MQYARDPSLDNKGSLIEARVCVYAGRARGREREREREREGGSDVKTVGGENVIGMRNAEEEEAGEEEKEKKGRRARQEECSQCCNFSV